MKKNIFLLIIIIIIFSFFNCGVLLDTVRVEGEWELREAEFYAYNPAINANYTYIGRNKRNPTETQPIIAAFFGISQLPEDGEHVFIVDLKRDKRMRIYDKGDDSNIDGANYEDGIVRSNKGRWSVDNYENTLNLAVNSDDLSTDNLLGKEDFWRKGGFKIKNYWPMPNYESLEITIKSTDIGKPFYISLKNDKKVRVHTMKGKFRRPGAD
ncbi:MAG: hypothetical protein JXB50_11010 [Spirochaetes bacterium]|nr:hypothetical protein [Spirochaetota bacterium]